MAFNLEITFTGICGFVSNSDPDLTKLPRVCVVMPSTDGERHAIDGEPLCPHECYLEQGSGFGRIRTSLKWRRLKFDFTPAPVAIPIATDVSTGLIDVTDSGHQCRVDPSIVTLDPPLHIMSQVWINAGTPVPIQAGSHWVIDPTKPSGVFAAHELRFTVGSLANARASLFSFDELQSVAVDLTPSAGVSTVALRIVNTCMQGARSSNRFRERDFKWYYELMNYATVRIDPSMDLNVPRSLRDHPLIGGNNCFPAFLGSLPMSF